MKSIENPTDHELITDNKNFKVRCLDKYWVKYFRIKDNVDKNVYCVLTYVFIKFWLVPPIYALLLSEQLISYM